LSAEGTTTVDMGPKKRSNSNNNTKGGNTSADLGGLVVASLPPLHAAAATGDVARVRQLITEGGVDVHGTDGNNATALDLAVFARHEAAARCLVVEFGADPTRRGFRGLTALEMAARVGHDNAARTHLKEDPRRLKAAPVDAGGSSTLVV
jgi:ankyrin repeat protein